MTKYLVKAKKGCTFVASNGSGEFLDEYRYRVFSNSNDVRDWESRNCLDIYGQLTDDASDEVLKRYLSEENGLSKFYDEFALNKPRVKKEEPKPVVVEEVKEEQTPAVVEEVKEEQTPAVVEEVTVNAQIVGQKKSKHSKRR